MQPSARAWAVCNSKKTDATLRKRTPRGLCVGRTTDDGGPLRQSSRPANQPGAQSTPLRHSICNPSKKSPARDWAPFLRCPHPRLDFGRTDAGSAGGLRCGSPNEDAELDAERWNRKKAASEKGRGVRNSNTVRHLRPRTAHRNREMCVCK